MTETKRCLICGETKPLELFHFHKKGKQGRQPRCKECTSAWHRAYNALPEVKTAKKPRADKYNEKYRTEFPDKMRAAYAAWKTSHPSSAIGKNLLQ